MRLKFTVPQFRLQILLLSLFVVLLTPCLGLSGCTAIESWIGSPTGRVLAPDIVNLAVAATIGTDKATVIQRAQKIKDIATQLLADETALTSIATLEADVNAQIAKLNLPPPDLVLAQSLASALEISAQAYMVSTGKGVAVTTASVAISTVLNQIIAESKAFGAV